MKRLVLPFLLSAIGIAIIAGGGLLSRPEPDDSSDTPVALPALDTQQTSPSSPNPCEWNEQIDRILPKLLAEYRKIEAAPTIEKMVSLVAEIRGFINSRPQYFPCGDHKKYWDD